MVQLMLLHALDFAPDHTLTVNQLKQTMVDESPNVSRALNKLVDKEYVTKKRCDKDQRTVFITATEQGLQAHRDGDKALMMMSVNLSNDEINQLYGLLKKL
nr:MarR family transcriptional regulator [Psychrobium sp. MM17-31]